MTIMKFGKLPAKLDARNLKMAAILKVPVEIPTTYSFDTKHRNIPTPMFLNDIMGDCVIAGRAHQSLRFEHFEQNNILNIIDDEVREEYLEETGGEDTGLYLLDSIKLWRKKGWIAGGERYKIKAFAEIDPQNHEEVKATIFADIGAGFGFALPDSAIPVSAGDKKNPDKWKADWKSTDEPMNPDNGHYVYVFGYNKTGPKCVTWGQRQQMSWKFLDKYCDEGYGIIDAINTPKKQKYLDSNKIDAFLKKLK